MRLNHYSSPMAAPISVKVVSLERCWPVTNHWGVEVGWKAESCLQGRYSECWNCGKNAKKHNFWHWNFLRQNATICLNIVELHQKLHSSCQYGQTRQNRVSQKGSQLEQSTFDLSQAKGEFVFVPPWIPIVGNKFRCWQRVQMMMTQVQMSLSERTIKLSTELFKKVMIAIQSS